MEVLEAINLPEALLFALLGTAALSTVMGILLYFHSKDMKKAEDQIFRIYRSNGKNIDRSELQALRLLIGEKGLTWTHAQNIIRRVRNML
ncbi:hypothetical protein VPHD148_0213 [Vibrio phage D148]